MTLASSFLDLVYPPLCSSCGERVDDGREFCSCCREDFCPIHSQERCPRCFSSDYSQQKQLCADCLRCPPLLNKMASTFTHEGAAASLTRRLKYANQPHLAEGMAAFMFIQWEELGWPWPDALVPVPMPRMRRWMRGYNQSLLLALSLGEIFQVPVVEALKRSSGELPQAGLGKKARKEMQKNSVTYRQNKLKPEQTLLLIDDVMTTGTTLRRCAEALFEAYPSALYSLTFCVAH